jgi:hypothetical protein
MANDGSEWMWKEVSEASFEMLSRHLPRGTQTYHKNHIWLTRTMLISKLKNFKLHGEDANHCAMMFS